MYSTTLADWGNRFLVKPGMFSPVGENLVENTCNATEVLSGIRRGM